jgi:hypothetical protein
MKRDLLIKNIETGCCGVDEAQEVRKLFDKLDAQIERNGYLSRRVSGMELDSRLVPDYEGGAGK